MSKILVELVKPDETVAFLVPRNQLQRQPEELVRCGGDEDVVPPAALQARPQDCAGLKRKTQATA
jgi:hypothetical protein